MDDKPPTVKTLAVYCGSSKGHDARFASAAEELGKEIAANDIDLVYGGGNVGAQSYSPADLEPMKKHLKF